MENYRISNTPVRSKMRDSRSLAPPGSATTAVKSQRDSNLTENASKSVPAADLQETSPERKPEIKNDFQPFMDTEALNQYVRKGGIRQYGATILTTASDSEEFDPEENSRRVLREILRQREERRQRAQTHVSPSPSVKTEHHRASVPYDIHRDTSETGEREVHLSPTPVVNEAPRHADPADRDEDFVEDDMDVESDHARPLRGGGLSVAAINTRLDAVGRAAYDIQDIGPADLRATVTRALMGHLYGGGQQTMFPNPSSHKLKNGFDNLGFINRKLNPYAPTRPGHTGLFFVMNPLWTGHMTKRLFVQLGQSRWLYLGLYQFIPVQPLSVDEFQQLEPVTRSGWVNHMFSKQWGRQFLIRIALRDENGGIEPPAHQVAAIFADRVASKSYADRHRVTEQQVMNAFLSGKERLCVSGLKCIDYDVQWKRYLIEQGRDFVPKKKNIPREDIELDEDRFLGQDRQPKPRRRERPRRAVDLDLAQPISNDARRVSADPTVIRQRLKEAGLGSDSSDLSEIESGGEEEPTASDGGVSEMEVEAMIWELL